MIYGYARVSSITQQNYGTSLGDQADLLKQKGAEIVFSDAYTGTKLDRPELDKLLKLLKPGDTLIVSKMDRLGRSAADIQNLTRSLMDRGIDVHILNMGIVNNTPTGRLLFNMLSAFAEYERDMIFERTQRGKTIRRMTDPEWREGRKPLPIDKDQYEEWREKVRKGASVTEACKSLGISRAKWYRMVELA